MHKTVEAILDENGKLRLLEKVNLSKVHRVLVTFLEEDPEEEEVDETTRLSETALSADWNRPEEDEAWQHLQ